MLGNLYGSLFGKQGAAGANGEGQKPLAMNPGASDNMRQQMIMQMLQQMHAQQPQAGPSQMPPPGMNPGQMGGMQRPPMGGEAPGIPTATQQLMPGVGGMQASQNPASLMGAQSPQSLQMMLQQRMLQQQALRQQITPPYGGM